MKFEIVEMVPLSGSQAKVYSIIAEGQTETLFDQFIEDYSLVYKEEIKELLQRLYQIGHTTGARECYFKHEGDRDFENQYGRFVWALYDQPNKNLRLYCIRFANIAIILGGGGPKPKQTIKWQDDPKLKTEVEKMMAYAKCIHKQLTEGTLYWSEDKTELEGIFKNYDNE